MVETADGSREGPLERRERIRRRILAEGYARVDDLARSYGVSVMTVHRDLDALVNEGWLAELREAADVELIVLGGRYQRLQDGCYGLQTIDAIERLHADVLFMSTTAVMSGCCYHRSEATLMVRRAMMEHTARTVLMIDHAK